MNIIPSESTTLDLQLIRIRLKIQTAKVLTKKKGCRLFFF